MRCSSRGRTTSLRYAEIVRRRQGQAAIVYDPGGRVPSQARASPCRSELLTSARDGCLAVAIEYKTMRQIEERIRSRVQAIVIDHQS